MEYIISGSDNLFLNGVKVKNSNERHTKILNETFKKECEATIIKNIPSFNTCLEMELEIIKKYGFEFLKQKTYYLRGKNNKIVTIKEKYYSNIEIGKTHSNTALFLKSELKSFSCLHFTDTFISSDCGVTFSKPKRNFISNQIFIIKKEEYINFIKKVLIKKRFQ